VSKEALLQKSAALAENQFTSTPAVTPVLTCQPRTWVGIQLVDRLCRPVAGEPYRITLPDGRVVEGKTDGNGAAGADDFDPGSCRIAFPELDSEAWRSECDCPKKQVGAEPTFIEFVLVDAANQPAAGERFRIKHPDGTIHEGLLGPNGSVRYDGCPAGAYSIALPDLDQEAWVSCDA
jgi:hypothetical protein